MNMREKMARAMCVVLGRDPDLPSNMYRSGKTLMHQDVVIPRGQTHATHPEVQRLVNAALDALMDPTEGMHECAIKDRDVERQCIESASSYYFSMIRAAKEGK